MSIRKTMKKILHITFIFFCITKVSSQNYDEDYVLLDRLIEFINKENNISIYEKPSIFLNQESFFSESTFETYTYPTIGVDCRKVKKIINFLDFKYLANEKIQTNNWDFSKIKHSVILYSDNPSNFFDKIRRFKISKPIYSEDKTIAFIYYEDICGYIGCGSGNVIIFRKKCGKWKKYIYLPIWIS